MAIKLQDIENRRPKLLSVDGVPGLQETDTIYSDTVITYSNSSQVFGGVDRMQGEAPKLYSAKDRKPGFDKISDRAIQFYALSDRKPKFASIGDVESTPAHHVREGVPVGLLIAITYDKAY